MECLYKNKANSICFIASLSLHRTTNGFIPPGRTDQITRHNQWLCTDQFGLSQQSGAGTIFQLNRAEFRSQPGVAETVGPRVLVISHIARFWNTKRNGE